MNFNYDLTTWIGYFIGAFVCTLSGYLSGSILLKRKVNILKPINLIALIIFTILTIINTLLFDNIAKIFGVIFIIFGIIKVIFKENNDVSFKYSIVIYIMVVLSDLTLTLFISIFVLLFHINNALDIVKTIIGNIFVLGFVILYSYIFRKIINKTIKNIDKDKIIYVLILGTLTIFVLIASMYNLYLNNWKIDYRFIINIIVFIGCSILAIVLLKQYLENKDVNDKYKLLKDYLKTSAELIEKYSTTVHKSKNNLIAIRGYLKTNPKEAEKYINNLLEIYDEKKYIWFNKMEYIKIDSIRYLVYYKLSKAETNNLKIHVDISKSNHSYKNRINTIKDNNILLEIMGEFFDNAIYACNESKEKELNFMMYEENNIIKFIISNTYKGKLDLSQITKNGYTTKGNNHGLGLYDIEKTIKKEKWLSVNYEILDNYFVVTLILDMNKKRNQMN